MNPYHRPVDAHVRLMTKVARMYHERGLRQAEIAEVLNVSQAKVSRLLKRAAEVGIVRTTVSVQAGLHADLEDRIAAEFDIADVVVVDVDGDADDRDIISAVGAGAAAYLEATLGGGDRIGISTWSETLLAMADRMRPFTQHGAATVVQLLGGIGASDAQASSRRLLENFAHAVGAEPAYVQAPAVVQDRAVRDSLLASGAMDHITRLWSDISLAIVGIGRIEPSDTLVTSGNAFTPDQTRTLVSQGAVGDICHRIFRADGTAITGELDDRVIAIPSEAFRAIPRRVGVAGGPRKHQAVLGAVRGGWVNALITDVHTGRALVDH